MCFFNLFELCREEERTCQLFAAVAVHTLNRSFETAVEKVRGVSQLQLLYEEFARLEIHFVVWWFKIIYRVMVYYRSI